MTQADLDLFEEAIATPDGTGEYQWFGFTTLRALRERFERDGLLGVDGGVLAVTVGDRSVGRVEWFASHWGRPATSQCWSLAIGLLPAARGQGIGGVAHRLLADYLFDHSRVNRLQAWTDSRNIPEQRALLSAGFQLEGTLRQAQWRSGAWHDQLLYSLLREDPRPAG